MSVEAVARARRRFFGQRVEVLGALVAVVLGLLVFRLYYLQVVRGPHFRRLAEENRISLIRVRAPRGVIYDRYGNALATNRPSFSVTLDLESTKDLEGALTMLAGALALERGELARRVRAGESYRRYEPVRIKEDVDRREVAVVESLRYAHPGVKIEVEPRRSYVFGTLASHVLGYVGQISPAELKARAELGYRPGDHIGKTGIEKEMDAQLKGRDGFQQVEVDSLGRGLRVLSDVEPVPGNDVRLTLDLGIQQAAEAALEGRAGAVVVVDPRDGSLLAAASSPPLDPNRFSHGLSQEEWEALNLDPLRPLQNRMLQGQYPPGSVFKIVTALAGLEAGAVTTGTSHFCRGALRFGNRDFRCWKRGGHGEVGFHRALVESCDVYFYQVGIKAGIDAIARCAQDFGLGRPTGLESGSSEASGLVPSSEWKRKARGEPWYPGETLSAAIGQGYNLVTPLQAALLAATVANGGTVFRPRLVRRVTDGAGHSVREYEAEALREVRLPAGALAAVREALAGVVNEPGGTGGAARVPGVRVAGKTGTAQVVGMAARGGRRAEDPDRFKDHAWFVCYAPADFGEVAVAVLVEHGGHGGSASAPVAGRILREMRNLGHFQVVARAGDPAAQGEAQ